MKIVIDIPEYIYKLCQGHGDPVYRYIANGTPLPKGHGDLIDRNELLKQPMDLANYPSNYVRIAPTIIEADTESEDNECKKY